MQVSGAETSAIQITDFNDVNCEKCSCYLLIKRIKFTNIISEILYSFTSDEFDINITVFFYSQIWHHPNPYSNVQCLFIFSCSLPDFSSAFRELHLPQADFNMLFRFALIATLRFNQLEIQRQGFVQISPPLFLSFISLRIQYYLNHNLFALEMEPIMDERAEYTGGKKEKVLPMF